MKLSTSTTFFCLLVICGCSSQSISNTYILTDQERHYCDSLKLDSSIIALLRTQTDSAVTLFPTRLDFILDKDIDVDSSRKQYPGLLFNAATNQTQIIVNSLYDSFQNKGYTIFVLDLNFGFQNKPDIIAILSSTDKYQILTQVQTDGINWEIDNDSLINIIKRFDKKYSLELVGAGDDWCEFTINKQITDWMALAKEAYKVCPDVVEQGTGTVEILAEEMKRTNRLYFWWD